MFLLNWLQSIFVIDVIIIFNCNVFGQSLLASQIVTKHFCSQQFHLLPCVPSPGAHSKPKGTATTSLPKSSTNYT